MHPDTFSILKDLLNMKCNVPLTGGDCLISPRHGSVGRGSQ